MTTSTFNTALRRGAIFESGIGYALARQFTGTYTSMPYSPEYGQPSGDGVLRFGGWAFTCEMKAETYNSPNMCFETNGAGGRDSGLTLAADSVDRWVHYHAKTDTLISAPPAELLGFLEEHGGQSGVQFRAKMGDGGRSAGYIAPVNLLKQQPFVHTFNNFSGQNWTGVYAMALLE